jgi:hypothetical protein
MRGRVAFLSLLAVLLAKAALPQCSYSPVASAPFRSTAYDLAVDGNDLWMATGYGVSLFDRSVDPPKLSALVPVPQTTKLVRASNGLAYAGSGDSVAVIRKAGKQLQLASTFKAAGTVNDLLLTPNYLYVATKSGLAQYDLLDPQHPSKTNVTLATSSANVTSLAMSGSLLFVADGDASVERFDLTTPNLPHALNSVSTLAHAATVHVVNNRLYVSDGLQTEIFVQITGTPASAAVIGVPTTSAAPLTGDALFAGGNDRRVRAFDLSVAGSPVELYRNDTPVSSGNVNRVNALAAAAGRLYVAAGDGGLVTYDTSGFTTPFALRSYTTSSTPSSVVSLGDHIYTSPASGGILEYSQSPGGALTQARTWDATHVDVVRDGGGGFLLSTSGKSATLWTLQSTIPVVVSSVTFSTNVTTAALEGTKAIAVLDNGSLATADMSLLAPVPQAVTIPGASKLGGLARSGNAVTFVQDNSDGTTSLFFFANTSVLSSPTASIKIDGAPVGTIALNGTTAAIFTFKGINLIDFSSGGVRTLAKSNSVAPRELAFAGPTLTQMTQTELIVWSTDGSGAITARFTLPSDGGDLSIADGSTLADIVTGSGVSSVALTSTSRLPIATAPPTGNDFFKHVIAAGNRVYLFGNSVEILTNGLGFVAKAGSGVVDAAASSKGLFTLSGAPVVTAWSPDGAFLKSATFSTAPDAQSQAIFTAGDAVWVWFTRGCVTTGCEQVTLVLDPVTLAQTDQIAGGITSVATFGTRAYAIAGGNEIRVYDISNPAHPVQTATQTPALTNGLSLLSIGGDANNVFVLADRLTTYTASSLSATGTQLDSFTGVVGENAYADQRLRGTAPCLLVSGRNANTVYSAANPTAWTSALPFAPPSFVRGAASVPGTFYLLTDHSLEVLSTGPLPKPAKPHAAGH